MVEISQLGIAETALGARDARGADHVWARTIDEGAMDEKSGMNFSEYTMKTGWQKITVYDQDEDDDYDYWFNFKSNGESWMRLPILSNSCTPYSFSSCIYFLK